MVKASGVWHEIYICRKTNKESKRMGTRIRVCGEIKKSTRAGDIHITHSLGFLALFVFGIRVTKILLIFLIKVTVMALSCLMYGKILDL